MVTKRQFLLLTGLGGIVLLLVLTNIVLYTRNRGMQETFAARAQYIQQSQQIEPVYRGVLGTLAQLAAGKDDEQIRQLLASQGISYSVNAQSDGKAMTPDQTAGEAVPSANGASSGGAAPSVPGVVR